MAVALICDFLKNIWDKNNKPSKQNWYGLLYWSAKLMPILNEQSKSDLVKVLCKIYYIEP